MAATLTRTALRASTSRLSTTHSSFAARQASPIFRRFLATPRGEQPRLRIGSEAPNFQAKTTNGDIDFHQWSANDLSSHSSWVNDINALSQTTLTFPIIADASRSIAWLYDMISTPDLEKLSREGGVAFTIRSVFIIDPAKKIRLTMMYPASTGRNTAEVLRVVDALQMADGKGVATPVDWGLGEDVIVPAAVSTEEARRKFGEGNVREVRPYLRFTKM
ncbi:hypothetical protein LTR74_002749 [Friedmanniomyces endolithicus]|nr:hypothetical protein LTR74_002749 [Friedmanniomyces endolithicus]